MAADAPPHENWRQRRSTDERSDELLEDKTLKGILRTLRPIEDLVGRFVRG
jgi:hypothetical protein